MNEETHLMLPHAHGRHHELRARISYNPELDEPRATVPDPRREFEILVAIDAVLSQLPAFREAAKYEVEVDSGGGTPGSLH